jgi:hypothetical protein
LVEVVQWAGMKFKAVKCRSLVMKKGIVTKRSIKVAGELIPSVCEQGVKSLGRWYKMPLSDSQRGRECQEQAVQGLRAIDRSALGGKFKCWGFQHILLPKIMWPLMVYDIPLSKVEAIEKQVNGFIRKWLGVPRCLSSVALYGKTSMLQLPFASLVEEFKVGKVRLQLMLRDSPDSFIRNLEPELEAGRKWRVLEALNEAESRVRFENIRGNVQVGRRGLGWSKWSFAGSDFKERRDSVCNEIRKKEEEARVVKGVQLSSQGESFGWQGVVERKLTWKDVWKLEPVRVGFLVRSVFNCLPTKLNLRRWGYVDDVKCWQCGADETLEHVLCGCKVALSEGRYTWRHNKVLEVMVEAVKMTTGLKSGGRTDSRPIQFIGAGGGKLGPPKKRNEASGNQWEILVDLEKRLVFPQDIVVTTQRPDMVLQDAVQRRLMIVELTVPWEANVQESHQRKKLRYEELRLACELKGWRTRCYAVEVGCRGFAGLSLRKFYQELGLEGKDLRNTLAKAAECAERASAWLWLKRNEKWVRSS